jgi:hypothetical protein
MRQPSLHSALRQVAHRVAAALVPAGVREVLCLLPGASAAPQPVFAFVGTRLDTRNQGTSQEQEFGIRWYGTMKSRSLTRGVPV